VRWRASSGDGSRPSLTIAGLLLRSLPVCRAEGEPATSSIARHILPQHPKSSRRGCLPRRGMLFYGMADELKADFAALLERACERGFDNEATEDAKVAALKFCEHVQQCLVRKDLPTAISRLLSKPADDADRKDLMRVLKQNDLSLIRVENLDVYETCAWCYQSAQGGEVILKCPDADRQGDHRYDGWTHATVECRQAWDAWRSADT